jgi:predicted translin family RNA/ssDNA-binding protein
MIKPSPYVDNLFQTMTGKNLIIKNDEIKAHTGYTHKFALQIIKEENAHDQKGRVFKQIFVTAPLDDNPNKHVMMRPDPIYKFHTSQEYIGYLSCAVEDSEAAYKFAVSFIDHFNNSYIMFKQFAKEAYNKVKSALNDLKALVLKIEQFSEVPLNIEFNQALCEMVESNVLFGIYNKLFAYMIESHADQERLLIEKCEVVLRDKAKLGLDSLLEDILFEESKEVMNSINEFRTPWEKLEVLVKLAQSIEKECKRHLYKVDMAKAEKWEMSADKYFPLLIYFIVLNKPKNLQANLTFVTEFSVASGSGGKRYHLTNLLAAVHTVCKIAEESGEREEVKLA